MYMSVSHSCVPFPRETDKIFFYLCIGSGPLSKVFRNWNKYSHENDNLIFKSINNIKL